MASGKPGAILVVTPSGATATFSPHSPATTWCSESRLLTGTPPCPHSCPAHRCSVEVFRELSRSTPPRAIWNTFLSWVHRFASETAAAQPTSKMSRSRPTNSSHSGCRRNGSSSTEGFPAPPGATVPAWTTPEPPSLPRAQSLPLRASRAQMPAFSDALCRPERHRPATLGCTVEAHAQRVRSNIRQQNARPQLTLGKPPLTPKSG